MRDKLFLIAIIFPMVLGCGLAVVYLIAAGLFFAAVFRHAIRTGLIARDSAETFS